MEPNRNRKVKESAFSRAYKFTGASSASDKTNIRVKRRSVEQRDLRHDLIDQRRQIDLSPVNEGDSTIKDHSYKDKTPTKPKVDRVQAGLQQAERLKLWKAEREEKRKQELEKQKKAPFRFRKMSYKDQEIFDRKKLAAVKSSAPPKQTASAPTTGKRQPAKITTTNRVTTKQITIPLPAKSYERPTMGSKLRSTAESKKVPTTANTRQSRGRDVKEHKPVPQTSRTTRNNRNVSTEKPTTKATRQSARNKPPPVVTIEEDQQANALNLTKVSTARGCTLDSTDSFAPNDFTFNTASFVFKPLSPNSAAGFLYPGQDTSCSFLDHNPNKSSTPYKERRKAESINKEVCESTMTESPKTKKRKRTYQKKSDTSVNNKSSSTNNEQPDDTSDSTQINDTVWTTALNETVVSHNEPAPMDTSTVKQADKPSTPLRRGSRRSVLSASVIDEKSTQEEVKDKVSSESVIQSEPRQTRRSTRSSVLSEGVLNVTNSAKRTSRRSVSKEQTHNELETSVKKTKRGKRKSVLVSVEKETIPETEQENTETDSVFDPEPSQSGSSDVAGVLTEEKSNKKAALMEKFLSESDAETKKTPGRRGARNKSFAGFRLPDSQCAALSASVKRKRKSVMPKSPEEWVELLSKSPMIEMTRRTPKLGNSSFTAIDFDDVDLNNSLVTTDSDQATGASNMPADPKINLFKTLDNMEVTPEDQKEPLVTDKQEETLPSSPLTTETVVEPEKSDVHDVAYFRKLLVTETDRLNTLCSHWEEINKANSLTEEVSGQIRTTVGQGVLLMNQRFKQFRGLVDNCEFNTGEKETTCTDLDGFWDMIYFQVEDVDAKFENLKKLQANNWVDDTPKPAMKKIKKKIVKPVITKPVKSKFAAFRAQMNKKVETPGVAGPVEEKVFEMPNFFAISSPVKSPAIHCEAGSPRVPPAESTSTSKVEPEPKQATLHPSSAELLLRRTPARKSYAPAIPSPLLVDSTPKPRPRRSCTNKTPIPRQLLAEDSESVKESGSVGEAVKRETPGKRSSRRSICARKSVNFAETESVETSDRLSVSKDKADTAPITEDGPANTSEEKYVDDDVFAKYLQPMSVLYGHTEKENSPSPAKRRRSSTGLKTCPSSNRRRSIKKVHFDSPANDIEPSLKGPQTPFYKDNEKRVTRRSLSQNVENQDVLSEDSPQRNRQPRPSLLYTPPSNTHSPARPLTEVPTGVLISFTP